MHRRAPRVVCAPDVRVCNVRDAHRRRLVRAAPGQAVVLIDDDRVSNGVHVDVVERNLGHRPRSALPSLDPDPVVGVLDLRVRHCNV